jgi:hypothetical protein
VLIPASEETHGHTHLRGAFWKAYVAEFLKELPAADVMRRAKDDSDKTNPQ